MRKIAKENQATKNEVKNLTPVYHRSSKSKNETLWDTDLNSIHWSYRLEFMWESIIMVLY